MPFQSSFQPGQFKRAEDYQSGFGDSFKPITPGEDLSTTMTRGLGMAPAQNMQTSSDFAEAGLGGVAAKKKASVLADNYLQMAKVYNQQADAAAAAAQRRSSGGLFGGIGKLLGGVLSFVPGMQPVGAAISMGSGLIG